MEFLNFAAEFDDEDFDPLFTSCEAERDYLACLKPAMRPESDGVACVGFAFSRLPLPSRWLLRRTFSRLVVSEVESALVSLLAEEEVAQSLARVDEPQYVRCGAGHLPEMPCRCEDIDSDEVLLVLPDSQMRKVAHTVCEFYHLESRSVDASRGSARVIIVKKGDYFDPVTLVRSSLSGYLRTCVDADS
jgi:hypothetical protein